MDVIRIHEKWAIELLNHLRIRIAMLVMLTVMLMLKIVHHRL